MLIIEIILTIFAWRKGWRWLALIPMGLALLIGFIIGLSIGASGGSVADLSGGAILIDVAAIIALIVMVAKGPKAKEQLNNEEKKL
jgi:hypothetical protein